MTDSRRMTDSAAGKPTVIGKGIHVKGEISGQAPIEVWGSVEGTTDVEAFCRIRQGGKVGGEIKAQNVIIEGRVEGSITARERVELGPASEVKGDIAAKNLAIADGSFFQGQVKMTQDGRQQRFEDKRKP